MQVGEKVLMMDGVCTIRELLFECKFFKMWSLNKIDGYYKENINFAKNKIEKKELSECLNSWYIQLKEEKKR